MTREEIAAISPRSVRQIEQDIVDAHADEPPQLERAPEPIVSPPDPHKLIEEVELPVIQEVIQELLACDESEEFDERKIEGMFERAKWRVPRKPSWDLT